MIFIAFLYLLEEVNVISFIKNLFLLLFFHNFKIINANVSQFKLFEQLILKQLNFVASHQQIKLSIRCVSLNI